MIIGGTTPGEENVATSDGGGIFSSLGNVVLKNSRVVNNSAGAGAGGGINAFFGTVSLQNSTIDNNSATLGASGGIAATVVMVQSSTISGNSALGGGGGIDAITVMVKNSTVYNNLGGFGTGGRGSRDRARDRRDHPCVERRASGVMTDVLRSRHHVRVRHDPVGGDGEPTAVLDEVAGVALDLDGRRATAASTAGRPVAGGVPVRRVDEAAEDLRAGLADLAASASRPVVDRARASSAGRRSSSRARAGRPSGRVPRARGSRATRSRARRSPPRNAPRIRSARAPRAGA